MAWRIHSGETVDPDTARRVAERLAALVFDRPANSGPGYFPLRQATDGGYDAGPLVYHDGHDTYSVEGMDGAAPLTFGRGYLLQVAARQAAEPAVEAGLSSEE